jgi:hypothetical protein
MPDSGEGESQRGLTRQIDAHHETGSTEGNLPAPVTDVFGKLTETPPTEDPAFWPVRVLSELNSYIVDRDQTAGDKLSAWGVNARELGERYAPIKEHIQKVKTAYEILAYPHCKYVGSRENIEDELQRDRQSNEREQVELDDAELTILSKLTAARKIPFNPEKRVYKYDEVFRPSPNIEKALDGAEFIKWRGEQERSGKQDSGK